MLPTTGLLFTRGTRTWGDLGDLGERENHLSVHETPLAGFGRTVESPIAPSCSPRLWSLSSDTKAELTVTEPESALCLLLSPNPAARRTLDSALTSSHQPGQNHQTCRLSRGLPWSTVCINSHETPRTYPSACDSETRCSTVHGSLRRSLSSSRVRDHLMDPKEHPHSDAAGWPGQMDSLADPKTGRDYSPQRQIEPTDGALTIPGHRPSPDWTPAPQLPGMPNEILYNILGYLDVDDLLSTSRVWGLIELDTLISFTDQPLDKSSPSSSVLGSDPSCIPLAALSSRSTPLTNLPSASC